jgi:hypothetical protein
VRGGRGAEHKKDDRKERVGLFKYIPYMERHITASLALFYPGGSIKFIIPTSLHVRSAVRSYCHCQPGRARSANSHAVFSLQIDNNIILKSLFYDHLYDI